MIKGFTLGRPTQLLIAANLLMGLVVSAQLLLPAQPGAANAATTDDDQAALPEFGDTGIAAPPMAQLVDMMERPLFFPDRRMPEPEVQEAPPPPMTPLRLKLEGIAIAGGARVAVLLNLNGKSLMQLTEGESHDGWTLDSVTSTSARFSRSDGQTAELSLDPRGT
ncbi:MAG TPA: hypothetical protein VLS87_10670 [Woeseiaceae bacterium]|nr:hypothetical protein [Woeseiaceae bacterium]